MKYILTIIITFILSFMAIFYSVKVTDVEKGNITINILGFEQVYYFEK